MSSFQPCLILRLHRRPACSRRDPWFIPGHLDFCVHTSLCAGWTERESRTHDYSFSLHQMQRKHKCQLPATQPLTAPKAPQTKQGWFYFSREWQRKGLVDQQNLTPHACEEKSELQGVCERHQVLRKRSGEPCSRPDLLHDLGQINVFILKTNG